VLRLKKKSIIGIDLAGHPKNPTGWALWKVNRVKTSLVYSNHDILENIAKSDPAVIAIDAPFSLPKSGPLRKADKEMIRRGYRVFPPTLAAMRTLTLRAIKLNKLIGERGYKTIEVHPTSTRKALGMPSKAWGEIQAILESIGLSGDIKARTLTTHELDAITAALTAYLHSQGQTETLGNEKEGYIIIPKKQDWSNIRI